MTSPIAESSTFKPPELNPDHIKVGKKLAQNDDEDYVDDFMASGAPPSPAPERNEEHIKSASQLNQYPTSNN
jgi:hypothetical protein